VLASLGVDTVLAQPPPRVAVVSTGDELAATGGALARGKIRNSNRPALLAQLRADGFCPVDLGTVGDDTTSLTHVLEDGAATCDAVVVTGGVSVGDRDIVKVVLKELCGDTMRSMQVAVKPGKPFAFGILGERRAPVLALPGNPVSALVSYELFARPALRAMSGHQVLDRPRLSATPEVDLLRQRDGKLHLVRVQARSGAGGTLSVRPSGGQGSHMLRTMAEANALALLPDGEGVPAGGRVEMLLLDAERLGPLRGEGAW
jgi:molybdenum cofactor synthesis domain-containing protein